MPPPPTRPSMPHQGSAQESSISTETDGEGEEDFEETQIGETQIGETQENAVLEDSQVSWIWVMGEVG
jgi:hypothetical protein